MEASSLFYVKYVDYAINCIETNEIQLSQEIEVLDFCLNCLDKIPVIAPTDQKLLLSLVGRLSQRVAGDSKKITGLFQIHKSNKLRLERLERKIARLSHRIEFPESAEKIKKRWQDASRKAAMIGKGTAANPTARMLKETYWVEALPIVLPAAFGKPEQSIHLYKEKADAFRAEWRASFISKMSFEEFIYSVVAPRLTEKERNDLISHDVVFISEADRKNTAVTFINGKAVQQGKTIPPGVYMIVLDAAKEVLHIGKKIQGSFHHSSFESGAAVASAGMVTVGGEGKILKVIPYSGHYRPGQAEMDALRSYIESKLGVNETKLIEFVSFGSAKSLLATLGQLFIKYTHKKR